jgi:hypothetical protein
MTRRGFFSASTVEHEATGQRTPDNKTARSGSDHLSFTRWIDHPARWGFDTPEPVSRRHDRQEEALTIYRHSVRRTTLAAFVQNRARIRSGIAFAFRVSGEWLTLRAPGKPAITSSTDAIKLLQS